MRTLTIRSYEELRQVDHRAIIAWERIMGEIEEAAPSTVRRRLAALSSLFKHLVRYGCAEKNPVSEVERPAINRREGSTLAFSQADARKLLDKPDEKTLEGLRDRAILAVGLQVGLRRAEIASLTVEDFHQNRGYDSLRITRKGGRNDALAVHPNTAKRLEAYMVAAAQADDLDGPLFRPLSHNRKKQETRRHITRTPSTGYCANTRRPSASSADTPPTLCGRRLSPPPQRMAARLRMFSAPPTTASPKLPSSTTAADIIRRSRPAFCNILISAGDVPRSVTMQSVANVLNQLLDSAH